MKTQNNSHNYQHSLLLTSFSFIAMRSVSIVYKKDHRDSCSQLPSHRPALQPRRSLDDYYTHLIEKQQLRQRNQALKQEIIERTVTKSAHPKKTDLCNMIESLNIASLPLRHEQLQSGNCRRQQAKTQSNFVVRRKMSSSKVHLVGLNLVGSDDPYAADESYESLGQAKLKCLFKPKTLESKGTVLALSVNFVINEHYFWQEQLVEEAALRHWKMLQNYCCIAWICHRQESLKQLLRYAKENGVRLDAVYLIVPRKNKKLLTVGYKPLENDFVARNNTGSPTATSKATRLVVVNGLLVQEIRDLSFHSFYLSVPLLSNSSSIVHYTKVNPSDGSRLGTVIRILSQQLLPRPFNLMRILKLFDAHQEKSSVEECHCDLSSFVVPEKDLLVRLERLKQQTINYFSRSMSLKLNEKISSEQGQSSAQFIIGDTIRRNYKIFKQYQQYCQEYEFYDYHRGLHQEKQRDRKRSKHYCPLKYRNPTYLWAL